MSPGNRAPATAILVTYNSARHIGQTLDALLADPTGPAEIVVVDNASSDGTAAEVASRGVRWVPLQENTGFAGGCHEGARLAGHDVLVFLNPDATPVAGWLPPLVTALDEDGVGAAMATIELAGEPGRFATSGGALTYFGLAWVTDYGRPIPDEVAPVEVAFPSGTAMAMHRSCWDLMGGFRTDLFLYHEDTDLGWRLRLRGLRAVRVPSARVAHDYSFTRNRQKLFYLERNRLVLLATNYRGATLFLLMPALFLVEAGIVAVALRDGWGRAKVRSWLALGSLLPYLMAERRRIEASRVVGDAAMLASMDTDLTGMRVPTVRVPRGSGLVDGVLRGYLRFVTPLVRMLDRLAGF